MSTYTLVDLLDETLEKVLEAHNGWNVNESLLTSVWGHLFKFVESQLTNGKGVNIPNFGVFSFHVETINLGNRSKTVKTPIFVVNSTFGRSQEKRVAAKNIPVVQINHAQIAYDSNTNRDVVVELLKYGFPVLAKAIARKNTPLEIELGSLALLSSFDGVVRVRFMSEFLTNIKGFAGTRPSTAAANCTFFPSLDVSDPISYSKTLNKSLDALSLDRPGSSSPGINRYARSLSAGRQRAARPSTARPSSASADTEEYDDSEYQPVRRPDLEVGGGTLSISSRPTNPARKTRTNGEASAPGSASSTRSNAELCDLCKLGHAHDRVRAQNREMQKKIDQMHTDQELSNIRALQERERMDRERIMATKKANQQVNEEMMRQKMERTRQEKLNDHFGSIIPDKPPSTPPHVRKSNYKDFLDTQIEEKGRASRLENEEMQRERMRMADARKQHADEEQQRREDERRKRSDHNQQLMDQMANKPPMFVNINGRPSSLDRGTDESGADVMNVLQRNRPNTPILKSKLKKKAEELQSHQINTVNERKAKEAEERQRQAQLAEERARAYEEDKRREREEERSRKLKVQDDLRNTWADQTANKRGQMDNDLHAMHTSLHMSDAELLEHLKHCKKCGRTIGPQTDFRKKSGDYRQWAGKV